MGAAKPYKPALHVTSERIDVARRYGVNPDALMQRLLGERWRCRCEPDAEHNEIHLWMLDKHGRPFASCRVCVSRVFCGDVARFVTHGPCQHDPPARRCSRVRINPATKKPEKRRVALYTSLCRVCLARRFWSVTGARTAARTR